MSKESQIYVTWDIADGLKRLGFEDATIAYYMVSFADSTQHSNTPTRHTKFFENWNEQITRVSAPTWDQALAFLREKKNIDIYLTTECNTNEILGYTGHIHKLMATENPFVEIQADNIIDNYNYHKVMELTIKEAFKLLSQ